MINLAAYLQNTVFNTTPHGLLVLPVLQWWYTQNCKCGIYTSFTFLHKMQSDERGNSNKIIKQWTQKKKWYIVF